MIKKYIKTAFLFAFVLFVPIHVSKAFIAPACSDTPITGDWNGDGKTEIGVARVNADGSLSWYLDINGNGAWDPGIDVIYSNWGMKGDIPITGDWNGDGKTEIGVARPNPNGTLSWYFDMNGNGTWEQGIDMVYSNWGIKGDIPITGDWNGDGKTKIGVARTSANGNFSWFFDYNGNGNWDPGVDKTSSSFGITGDVPITGDWNGDGKTEIGTVRNNVDNSITWFFNMNGNAVWDAKTDTTSSTFGIAGDIPMTGDWNGDGKTKIGAMRLGGSSGNLSWYTDYNGNDAWDTNIDQIYPSFGIGSSTCIVSHPELGPEISVGLWPYSKTDIMNSPFQIDANKTYNIKDQNGNILAQVGGNSTTSVSYNDNQNQLTVTEGSLNKTLVGTTITFDAADGDNTTLIFNVHRSNYDSSISYNHYRGIIKVQYYRGSDIVGGNTGNTVTQIWIDNVLPLEQYVWGMGETTGTGPMEHTKVMTTIFRTYGFWYVKYANKYAAYGFQIRSDSGSQVYWGEDWEAKYPNIKTAAQQTRGIFASYGGDVALTPYSSWSDGNTRSFQSVWGSTDYPWCAAVSDPYGKNPNMTTAQLQAAGNSMVGLIANGSLNLAGSSHNKSYDWILKYYYTGISLPTNY